MEVVVPRKTVTAPFLPIKAASTATGLSQFFLREGCRNGTVPCVKSGNKFFVNVPKLLEKLNEMCEISEGDSK